MKYNLNDIVDNGEVYSPKLEEVGIKTTEDLVSKVASPETRKQLAESTGIEEKKLLHFLHSIDLLRIKGVGTLYSTLFCKAGVCSVNELSEWKAEKLYNHLNEINGHQELVQHLPSTDQLANFIEQAKLLPNIVIATTAEVEVTEEQIAAPTFWSKYGTSVGMLVFGAVVVGLSIVFRRQILAASRGISFYNQMTGMKRQFNNLVGNSNNINFNKQFRKVQKQVSDLVPQDISFDKQINQAKAQVQQVKAQMTDLVDEINNLRK